jgi:hypothetical protein
LSRRRPIKTASRFAARLKRWRWPRRLPFGATVDVYDGSEAFESSAMLELKELQVVL